jgi:hypothetical protein
MRNPNPLAIRFHTAVAIGPQPGGFQLGECLALSKMNWNNTRFDRLLPITLRAAKQVGSILKYPEGESTKKISPAYRLYM